MNILMIVLGSILMTLSLSMELYCHKSIINNMMRKHIANTSQSIDVRNNNRNLTIKIRIGKHIILEQLCKSKADLFSILDFHNQICGTCNNHYPACQKCRSCRKYNKYYNAKEVKIARILL